MMMISYILKNVKMKSRSLDFTVCTTKCTIPCWRKLTKEEEEWLKNNPNRMSYADFSNKCEKLKELDE